MANYKYEGNHPYIQRNFGFPSWMLTCFFIFCTFTNAVATNQCATNVCQNGGTCQYDYYWGTSKCNCSLRYYGDYCQFDRCHCGSHGRCLDILGYKCLCDTGYTGANCDIQIAPQCLSNPCQNGGNCTAANYGLYSCKCDRRYYGAKCEYDSCSCGMHGTCVTDNLNGLGYTCLCDSGFEGDKCTDLPCSIIQCMNGGLCKVGSSGNSSCLCSNRYYGSFCQYDRCSCGLHGTCSDDFTTADGYQCVCDSGYNGSSCSKLSNPCKSRPCQNGGICTELDDVYSCSCDSKHYGSSCQYTLYSSTIPAIAGGTSAVSVLVISCIFLIRMTIICSRTSVVVRNRSVSSSATPSFTSNQNAPEVITSPEPNSNSATPSFASNQNAPEVITSPEPHIYPSGLNNMAFPYSEDSAFVGPPAYSSLFGTSEQAEPSPYSAHANNPLAQTPPSFTNDLKIHEHN